MNLRTKQGRTISDEELDHLADEAEAGYDLSDWVVTTRRGRRPLSPAQSQPGEHSPRIAARIPASLRDEIARYAAEEGRTVSQVMRDLLEAYARERRLGRGR